MIDILLNEITHHQRQQETQVKLSRKFNILIKEKISDHFCWVLAVFLD